MGNFEGALFFSLTHVPLIMLILACFIGIIFSQSKPSVQLSLSVEQASGYFYVLAIGISGIWSCIMHIFFPQVLPDYLGGWQSGIFEFEVAMANLGLGIIGVMAFWQNDNFRLAVLIMASCLFWGEACAYLYQLHYSHNYHLGNSGAVFYTDILIPAIAWMLFLSKQYFHEESF